MKKNLPITNTEIKLDGDRTIISTTDLKGQITYVNKTFKEISGFSEEELIGQSHNIVRHPDMPPEAFSKSLGYHQDRNSLARHSKESL